MFENQEISIPCKKCGRQHKKTIAWIRSHSGAKIKCQCGTDLVIDASQLDRQIKELEKQLKNLFNK